MDHCRYRIPDTEEQMESPMTDMRLCLDKNTQPMWYHIVLILLTEVDSHFSLKVTTYKAEIKSKSL